MTTRNTKDSFSWSETDEPHATRRKLILAKYPEITKLFGPEPRTFWIVAAIFLSQTLIAYWMRDASWGILLLVAYAYGGTVNHSLQLAVHELSHNLCWENQLANKWTAFFANLVTGFPSSITFQRYHMEHHTFQGVDGVDTDVPTEFEIKFFDCTWKKVVWLFLQPVFYALRPMMVKPKSPSKWEGVNWITQMTFNVAVIYFWGWKSFAYLIAGTLLGLGLHPTAGHFVAEHYELNPGQETYSYYGSCNRVNFNVGYHNEHHDFPKIAWSNLPKVRKIAPEFYSDDKLMCYNSYLWVMWKYITDPAIGPAARIKRSAKYAKESTD